MSDSVFDFAGAVRPLLVINFSGCPVPWQMLAMANPGYIEIIEVAPNLSPAKMLSDIDSKTIRSQGFWRNRPVFAVLPGDIPTSAFILKIISEAIGVFPYYCLIED